MITAKRGEVEGKEARFIDANAFIYAMLKPERGLSGKGDGNKERGEGSV